MVRFYGTFYDTRMGIRYPLVLRDMHDPHPAISFAPEGISLKFWIRLLQLGLRYSLSPDLTVFIGSPILLLAERDMTDLDVCYDPIAQLVRPMPLVCKTQ